MNKASVATRPKVYWDSCVFLSLIEATPNRIDTIIYLMNEAEQKRIEIWTSLFTIAEVAFIKQEKDEKQIDLTAQSRIDKLWQPGSVITLVEPHIGIMLFTAAFVREAKINGFGIKAKDAIHIATAKEVGIKEIHTYDGFGNKWDQVKNLTGITICNPRTDTPTIFDALSH